MASQHINITGQENVRGAPQLRSHVDSVQRLVSENDRLKAIYDQISSGGDWVALADYLGVTEAEAETVYNLFVGFKSAFDGISVATHQLIDRLG